MSYIFNPLQAEGFIPVAKQEKVFGEYKHTRSTVAPQNPIIGDSWEEITSNSLNQWLWNGSLWLSPQIYTQRFLFAYMGAYNFQGAMLEQQSPISTGHFIEKTSVNGSLGGNFDQENYLIFNLDIAALNDGVTNNHQQLLSLQSAGNGISIYKELEINKFVPSADNPINSATLYVVGVGAPASIINGNFAVHYRYARSIAQAAE